MPAKKNKANKAIVPYWGVIWILASNAFVIPDFLYVLLQPHSLKDGKYGGMLPFTIWHLYAEWDKRYSNPEDVFNKVQSILNIVELIIGVGTVLLLGQNSKLGAKILLAVSFMTFYKTAIYFLMEIVSGMEYTIHNPVSIRILVALLSLPWIVVPFLLAKSILERLIQK